MRNSAGVYSLPKNTYVNGATRWLTPQKALIQLSLRYSYADIFWFTFFHEIGHLLRDSKKEMFVDFEGEQVEQEADKFAQKILIPSRADYKKFKESLTPENLRKNLLSFSKTINIDPGIVAGRLGKETGEWRSVAPFRKQLRFK
jgi:HTH-type transcriptional regulator/antitoxin HigA